SAEAAMEARRTDPVDLLVVDIQMPGLLGTEFVKSLGSDSLVVFSTAFREYAVEGFQLDAVDYLLKPYGYPRFLKAAAKARDLIQMREAMLQTESVASREDFFFVRCGYKQVRVDIGRILYVEGEKDYARIVLDGLERPLLALTSLKALEERLQGHSFLRVHRSWIVHMRRVEAVEKGAILIGGKSIPIADKYKAAVEHSLRAA
ncbi:MAG: LytTR family DNA-binding domain-containing protein, partial [Fibrobacterota bacterium]